MPVRMHEHEFAVGVADIAIFLIYYWFECVRGVSYMKPGFCLLIMALPLFFVNNTCQTRQHAINYVDPNLGRGG